MVNQQLFVLSRSLEPTVGEILLDEENLLGKSEKELLKYEAQDGYGISKFWTCLI